ncbi:glycosyltransferase family 2 protein [Methylopila sp. Yamaguchi]|uniref:glycosyltransferase family 2 protein n=1 Tax=Methylopila sp. Yamaguchi TaxID=1437817 RepID=UPI000CC85CB9|nr:glycosyltransferase family 2 protein [Methylopila sp. Yamaguchi]GBD49348.1 glycosyl transferase family protein [Methylopila sp. Yamaguchi]
MPLAEVLRDTSFGVTREVAAQPLKIAVLLPCYNEEAAIGEVVRGFRMALPAADIYVYDNNSTDRTIERASEAGAIVRRERLQGKGNVVRRMLADVEADVYLMADGDLTYDPLAAPLLIDRLVSQQLDMVVATRQGEGMQVRRGHAAGNLMFNQMIGRLFGPGFTDILSGYRAVSRRFAKSFPASSGGFEIETELAIHALDLRLAVEEIPVRYGRRPADSVSKLSTFRDGFRILWTIAMMYRAVKPFRFFGMIALALAATSLWLAFPVITHFLETRLVPRLPTAVLAASIMQLSVLSFVCGIIVQAVSEGRREAKRLRYLELKSA